MAKVTISIRGRNYVIACDDGEEPRVLELARALDAEVAGLGKVMGGLGESHLLVITGLSLMDRISDARRDAERSEVKATQASGAVDSRVAEIERKAAEERTAMSAELAELTGALNAEKERVKALEQEIAAAAHTIDAIAARVTEA